MCAAVNLVLAAMVCSQEPYIFGNMFYRRGAWSVVNHHDTNSLPNASIMYEYFKTAKTHRDLDTLASIVFNRTPTGNLNVSSGSITAHLRMGDNVVDASCWETPCTFNGGQNPLSRATFNRCARWPYKTVVLLGSFKGGGWKTREATSREYYRRVTRYFETQNKEVVSKVTQANVYDWRAVDRDVIFASRSPFFICSGGTFSGVLGALVMKNGGKTCNCYRTHTGNM